MKNRKLQLRLNPILYRKTYSENKYMWKLEYRIDPTELKWYQKIFNIWSPIYQFDVVLGGFGSIIVWSCLVAEEELCKYKEKFKTENNLKEFNERQKRLFKEWKNKYHPKPIY